MKGVMWLFIFVLVSGLVCAGDWGDINDENNSGVNVVLDGENVSNNNLANQDNSVEDDVSSSDDSEEWTRDFYIALGVGGLGILIVALFLYFFLRGPKNKWKK